LQKVEQDEEEWLQNNSRFEDGLREIMRRHKVSNEPFFSEVSNLTKCFLIETYLEFPFFITSATTSPVNNSLLKYPYCSFILFAIFFSK